MRRVIYIATGLISIVTFRGWCQFENIILPTDLKQQTIITEPPTLRTGDIRAGINVDFIFSDRSFNKDGEKEYIMGTNIYSKSLTFMPGIQYGLTNRIEISARIPYYLKESNISGRLICPYIDYDTLLSICNKGRGIGDLETGIRFQLIREGKSYPSLRLGLFGIFPTGRKNPENIKNEDEYDLPTGYGNYIISADLLLKKVIYPFSITLFAYYNYNFKGKKVMYPYEDAIEFKRGNIYGADIGIGAHLNDWIVLINAFNYYASTGSTDYYPEPVKYPEGWAIAYRPSVYFQIRRFRLSEFVGIPVTGRNASADPSYSISLQYTF
ncbi:MAG: transporter [Bacteroidales bacterium]|nr:transporter [Bacteroidales bacterium]